MMSCYYLATCGEDVKFWDFPNLIVKKQLNVPSSSRTISNVSWSHEGSQLASLPFDDKKVILTYVKNNIFSTVDLTVDAKVTSVKFLKKSSRYLSLGCSDGKLLIWDLKLQKLKQSYSCSTQATSVVCLEPNWNDNLIAAGYGNGDIILYNLIMGQPLPALKTNSNQAIRCIGYNAVKKSMLGSSCDSGAVTLWDTNTKKSLHQFSSHFAPATGLSFSPVNDILLASAGLDKKIICYDTHLKSPVQTLTVDSPLTCIDFLNNGVMLAIGTNRGKVLLYDLRHPSTAYKTIIAHKTSVSSLSFQNIPSENQPKHNDTAKTKERSVTKPDFSNVKNMSSSDQVDNLPANANALLNTECKKSRNSLTREIFSPICEDQLISVAETPLSSIGRNTSVGDGLTVSSGSEMKMNDFPSSQVRRQPIGSGLQTPPLIGDRPITAGFAENDSKVLSANNEVCRPSSSSETRIPELDSYSAPISQTPSNVSGSVHVIQATMRSSNSSLNVFSPIDGASPTALIDLAETTSTNRSISPPSTSTKNSLPSSSVSQSRNIDGDDGSRCKLPSTSGAEPAEKSTSVGVVQHCAKCRERNQNLSELNSLKIDAIQKQIQELRDDLEDFHDMTHRDYLNLHVAIVKEFQMQLNAVHNSLQYFSINEDLVKQIEQLQEENRHLRAAY